MANTNAPFGFSVDGTNGGPVNYSTAERKIASTNATAIYYGDAVVPVTGTATGYIKQATASTVTLAGIFVGCQYYSTSQKKTVWNNYWPGSDATGDVTAFIVNDPNAQFLCQAGGTNVGFAAIGQYIQLNVGTGSTTTGISGMYVETPASTTTLPFIIVNTVTTPPTAPGTDSTSAYNRLIVAFNNEMFKWTGAGIA